MRGQKLLAWRLPPLFADGFISGMAGAWAYTEATTQPVLVAADDEVLENMFSVDKNAGSREKAAKWTINAWALCQKSAGGWEIVFHSTDERAKDYEM